MFSEEIFQLVSTAFFTLTFNTIFLPTMYSLSSIIRWKSHGDNSEYMKDGAEYPNPILPPNTCKKI
jgi:hypothetical protein